MRAASTIMLLLRPAPGAPCRPRARRAPPTSATARVVDLTHAFDERTVYWPTSPSAFELKQLSHGRTPGGCFYSANSFCTPEHGGTHLDAPIHFSRDARTLAEVPLEQLVGPRWWST